MIGKLHGQKKTLKKPGGKSGDPHAIASAA
jgi:hypothetical protein